jgi:hypothetical protein
MIPPGTITKYADDCSVHTPVMKNSSTIVESVNYIADWCSQNSMILNASKSVLMPISLKGSSGLSAQVAMNDTVLEMVPSVKILGVIVDQKLSFKDHVKYILSRVNSRIFILKRLYNHGVNVESRLKFYSSCILPVILYAIEAWYGFVCQADRLKLERVNNYALKLILGVDFSYEERLASIGSVTIESLYTKRRHDLFSEILDGDCSLKNVVDSYVNDNRRSRSNHSGSAFRFKTRTETFKRSFFIKEFLNC